MSIKNVILGYLSWQPMTGYDLKKIIADSEVLPWSANNNQIYRALVQLYEEGLVTKRIEGQDGAPDRHIYTITGDGNIALKNWAGSEPHLPQTRKPSLHQLMWADTLDPEELDKLLEDYLDLIGNKIFFIRVQADQKPNMPERTTREQYLWEMVYKNWIDQYELERKWIKQVRGDLSKMRSPR